MAGKESQPELFYRDVPTAVQELLKNLSLWGYIYIGRTGVGLTTSFRKETYKVGTFKACNEAEQFLGAESVKVLQVIAIEGPRWVPYKRVEEVYYGVKLPERVPAVTEEERGHT